MSVTLTGPRCRACQRSEQQCAYTYPCCEGCGHFRRLDARGNDNATGHPGRQRSSCDQCRRVRRACVHGLQAAS